MRYRQYMSWSGNFGKQQPCSYDLHVTLLYISRREAQNNAATKEIKDL